MKKRTCYLKDKVTYSNLLAQYKIVRSNCKNKKKVYYFAKDLNTNIIDMQQKLLSSKYEFSDYNIFLIRENKYRIIMSEQIEDKITTHFLVNLCLKPCLEPKMIDQNVATRFNLGSKAAYNFFEKYLKSIGYNKKIYALKIDISKYFYSIPHDILKKMLREDIKDEYALNLLFKLIDHTNDKSVNKKIELLINNEKLRISNLNISKKEKKNFFKELDKVPRYSKDRGLSIGCVVNQILSVYYLSRVDRYIKENLRAKHYVRYMDDLVILSTDVMELKNFFKLISKKINEYDLLVNPKSNIFILNNGFTFLGRTYKIKNNKLYKKVKNLTYHKALKNLNGKRQKNFFDYYNSKVSYYGLLGDDLLIPLLDEYDYLKKIFFDYYIICETETQLLYDKESYIYQSYLNFLKSSNYKINFLKYLIKYNIKCIYISRGSFKVYVY